MPDFLLELLSEEIPARMQSRARADLKRLVCDGLTAAGLACEGARAFSTPRRLALVVEGLPGESRPVREERKGPRVDAPDKAIAGFLRAAGLASLEDCEVRDDGKGAYYVAVVEQPGRPAPEIIAEAVAEAVRSFPWPKSMRWGSGSLRWVRPIQSILAVFAPKGEAGEVVPIEIDGIRAGDVTVGHRVLAPGPIRVSRFEDYVDRLAAAHVEIDAVHRRDMILADARSLAMAQGLELVDDPALADEVAGLVEWPVVLMGRFDEAFLAVPAEVLATTMRVNQKYFTLTDPKTGGLANRFVMVANVEASDGGKAIVAGNERVLAARLHDANFFWEQDLKVPLETRAGALADVVFHERLGSQKERAERIARLAREIAPVVGADPDLAERAARLAKADLVSGMVGEFPELQGVMGRYYARAQHEREEVADAIRDHYRPQGASDAAPAAPVSVAVALADKLDMLMGFWSIGEKPTGSKDPYALRRAALGVIRIVLENGLRVPLVAPLRSADRQHFFHQVEVAHDERDRIARELETLRFDEEIVERVRLAGHATSREVVDFGEGFVVSEVADLIAFFAERLKVYLRDQGARHDLIDAVFSPGGQDDLLMIIRRVEALGTFLAADDGANLLIGVKRAQNIVRIEERVDGEGAFSGAPDPKLFVGDEERRLYEAIGSAVGEAENAIRLEDFAGAMGALARLRAPVDAFFDRVTVNADDPALRANRLKLLNMIREATLKIADFSRIEG